ncbi:hypothetical protein [Ruminococcus sp.]|uniref:hypothetical protein n=1 Tax=Ruminococcus sp. TaxID=41978 RepID=UPI00259007F3|nr:hypothetical protein [Ruminococcus sp.]
MTFEAKRGIIIKLSTRERAKRAKNRRKLRDKRTSGVVVQKKRTQKKAEKISQKVLTKARKCDILKSTAQEKKFSKKELLRKKLQKSSEKDLTNEEKRGIIEKLITHKNL